MSQSAGTDGFKKPSFKNELLLESNVSQEMSGQFISENFIVVTREVLNEVILKFRIFFSG